MTISRWLYPVAFPMGWALLNWLNFQHPGDEYGGWKVGSLPGLWGIGFVETSGKSPEAVLPFVLISGVMSLIALGALMHILRVPWLPWLLLNALLAVGLVSLSLASFPSWERAMAKNGSIWAYVLPSMSLGSVASTLLMIVGAGAFRLWELGHHRAGLASSVNHAEN